MISLNALTPLFTARTVTLDMTLSKQDEQIALVIRPVTTPPLTGKEDADYQRLVAALSATIKFVGSADTIEQDIAQRVQRIVSLRSTIESQLEEMANLGLTAINKKKAALAKMPAIDKASEDDAEDEDSDAINQSKMDTVAPTNTTTVTDVTFSI